MNKLSGYVPNKYEREALETIISEKTQWDDAAVFVSEKLQYLMRNVIDQARRYYMGKFENPNDEVTGERKTWVPLTEWSVESVVKSVDLDTKDILIQPGTPEAVNRVPIIRALILNLLKKIGFGQLLNNLIRVLSRDGTVVVKTYDCIDPATKKRVIRSKIVDINNLWVDPTADTLQEGPVIERERLSTDEINEYKGVWKNIEYINFSPNVPKTIVDKLLTKTKVPYTEVWERWGKIKKSWITEDDKDEDTWIEGHIVASGSGTPSIIHLIRENPREDGIKPYEEAWYRKIDGRWYGRGVAEMLFDLQEYVNLIVNTRKSNNMVLGNGIFLIRKGSGLTPDMISSISAGGGIPVTDIDRDVKQLNVQDYRQSSYTDEDRAYLMADRVTSSFDINRGEAGRPSASATATLTQDRNIRDTFVLVQEGIGFFVERLITRQYLPLLKKILEAEDIIKITGDADSLAFIDEAIINHRVNEFKLQALNKTGFLPDDIEIEKFKDKQLKYLKSMGKSRFMKYSTDLFDTDVDVDIMITDERFNRVVAVQQLRDALIAFSRLPVASKLNTDAVLREMFNLMGIKGELFLEKPQVPILSPGASQVGRLLKEMPQELPNEGTAFENAAGMPQIGGAVQQPIQTQAPLESRLNISTPMTQFGG